MNNGSNWTDMLRHWEGDEHIHILLIIVGAVALYEVIRYIVPTITTKFRPDTRFYALPWIPLLRFFIIAGTLALIIPLIIIPTQENILVVLGAATLAAGFVLKDYISCLFAGLVLMAERAYRVGDWVLIDEIYGEVVELGLRTVTLRTADHNNVSIPHSTLWHKPLSNATNGQHDLLCVIHFFVHPDHDNAHVRQTLSDIAATSSYIKQDRPIVVVLRNEPFGLHYKVKAYPTDAREQFKFIADVTERGLFALHNLGLLSITAPVSVVVQH